MKSKIIIYVIASARQRLQSQILDESNVHRVVCHEHKASDVVNSRAAIRLDTGLYWLEADEYVVL